MRAASRISWLGPAESAAVGESFAAARARLGEPLGAAFATGKASPYVGPAERFPLEVERFLGSARPGG